MPYIKSGKRRMTNAEQIIVKLVLRLITVAAAATISDIYRTLKFLHSYFAELFEVDFFPLFYRIPQALRNNVMTISI